MLELIGGLLLTSVVPGLVTNRVDSGLCRALVGIRNQIWKPTLENHDLQRALLDALRDGLKFGSAPSTSSMQNSFFANYF